MIEPVYFKPSFGGVPLLSIPILTLLPPTEYRHTIADAFGFESMQATYVTTPETALEWFAEGLMRTVVVPGPDAGTVWEGFVSGVEIRIGQETRSIAIETMANRITVLYTTVLGTPGTTSPVSDADSQAAYGVKDRVETLAASTATAAANKAARILAQLKQPRAVATSGAATGEISGDAQLVITATGWYETLGWVVTSRSSTTSTSTTTQVGDLLATSGIGIGAVNAFLSPSTELIVSSGVSDTEYIAANTTYREKFEALLGQGNSGGNGLSWGVAEGRLFYVDLSLETSGPTDVQLRRKLGEGRILDKYNTPVAWWSIRPNTIYEVDELMDANTSVVTSDMAGRSYVARVTCGVTADQISVDLEGPNGDSIDRIIASIR